MSESLITKKALGETLKTLMREQPFEKISVKDICSACGLNRNSFYYHFKDKQDLVFWIFDYEFITLIRSRTFDGPFDLFETVAEYFYANREFYRKALAITGQNCFSEYFTEVFEELCAEQIDKYFGEDPNCTFYASFSADTMRQALVRWLNEGENVPPQELTRMAKASFIALSERGLQLYPEAVDDCRRRREKREREKEE